MLELMTPHSRPAPSTNALSITVFSERALIRELVVDFLRRHGFPQTVGRASCLPLWRAVPRGRPGVVFVDLENVEESASQLLRELRVSRPEIIAVAIGTPMQLAAQAAEADGWIELSHAPRRMTDAALAVGRHRRGNRLLGASPRTERLLRTWRSVTDRQRQVLALLGCGLDNQKLAGALGISERAVKAHVSALLDKFKADSRTELALIACHAGLQAPHAVFPFRS